LPPEITIESRPGPPSSWSPPPSSESSSSSGPPSRVSAPLSEDRLSFPVPPSIVVDRTLGPTTAKSSPSLRVRRRRGATFNAQTTIVSKGWPLKTSCWHAAPAT
jgi:hypothetical protein